MLSETAVEFKTPLTLWWRKNTLPHNIYNMVMAVWRKQLGVDRNSSADKAKWQEWLAAKDESEFLGAVAHTSAISWRYQLPYW